ncbi:MAG TPA: hypothetical protein IGS52_07585 [Oscillatoriaceae cyanobacterium M33_DOE_052]|uniref:DUF5678 domain-containing protein n=1 Tax=Planktothricoides sp. SpSt-374 TaxID=2282167 RepID=A0A7C3VIC6_9CYAN|nr:hypothetical protein [Oscillatoriaceae cyanobacterium M33_DOE_052]
MKNISETHFNPRLGRVFPGRQLTAEEIELREAELQKLMKRCDEIFEAAKPHLIDDYYDWFMVIEPESGDYFIDPDDMVAEQKADAKYPNARCVVYRINETGACHRV